MTGNRGEGGRFHLVSAAALKSWTGYLLLLTIAVAVAVEFLLAVRLWAQLTNQDIASGELGSVYSFTNDLVAPFLKYDSVTPVRPTGILEVATLTAIEAYLVGALIAVVTLFILRQVFGLFAKHAERRRARTALEDREASFNSLPAESASVR
jgi:hypothetical protein